MSTCPLNTECCLGNCEFCSQKGDCILMALFKKVENLENTLAQLAAA